MKNIETLTLPSKVVDYDGIDNAPLDYEVCGGDDKKESEYESPVDGQKINKKDVKNVDIDKIKQQHERIGRIALFKQNDKMLA